MILICFSKSEAGPSVSKTNFSFTSASFYSQSISFFPMCTWDGNFASFTEAYT